MIVKNQMMQEVGFNDRHKKSNVGIQTKVRSFGEVLQWLYELNQRLIEGKPKTQKRVRCSGGTLWVEKEEAVIIGVFFAKNIQHIQQRLCGNT